jgi:transcriptional regulator with GAF, ATPase, and Fis domain
MGREKFPDYIEPTKVSYLNGKPTTIHLRKCKFATRGKGVEPREFVFDKGTVSLGSMDDNDIVLRDDTVSRYHCKVTQEDDAFVVRDQSSTNGTFINQVRVREAYLSPNAVLRLGNSELIFQPIDEQIAVMPSTRDRFGDIIGTNIKMREIFGILEKIAPTNATILIEGETGTGKEVVAQTIHKMSQRAGKPFVVFDCGAVPESLIESELFGHEKGSFTGAIMTRQGLFELAQGGTIFLDELGELSLELQPKLLRVLEQREVRRVGSAKPIQINVRVIAATNRNLDNAVKTGKFREDLFFRLSVVRLFLPALRERPEDVPLLVKHFLKTSHFNRNRDSSLKLRSISREALNATMRYAWPGNIRELLNVIERACSLADGDCIDIGDLPDHISSLVAPKGQPAQVVATTAVSTTVGLSGLHFEASGPLMAADGPAPAAVAAPVSAGVDPSLLNDKTFKDAKEEWLTAFERDYIRNFLKKNNGNISHAAREADIDRKYFRKLMKKYGITADDAQDDGDDE